LRYCNQLVATSEGAGGFSYDALGRRVSASVNGSTASYIYDGINPAALSGNALLGSLNIDEIFAQVSSTGTTGYLRDGLNSTVGETGSAGTLTANYWYSPYGDSANTSAAPTPLQFTGRENDGATGLYYYRARYYSPQLGRFISEDPIGLAGGTNYYAYVDGNPISEIDPLGLWGIVGNAGGAAEVGGGAALVVALPQRQIQVLEYLEAVQRVSMLVVTRQAESPLWIIQINSFSVQQRD
jgi:RHS repeat-associated protein